ncbi:MAG: helix-turn-helix transcriptional regulator [Clostridia bacterium]|nr:helix-turn-helix transcriptional regulator [Clostridia bacterium]
MMNRIRDLREDMDLRQIDLANATGIDQKTISNYETGKTNPDSFAIIKLADFFNVSADYLIGRNYNDKSDNSNRSILRKIEEIQLNLSELALEIEKQYK